jgi:hypothetical protein
VLAGFAVVAFVGIVKVLPFRMETPMFGFLEAVIIGKTPFSLNTRSALRVGAVTAEIPSKTNGVGLATVAAKGGL